MSDQPTIAAVATSNDKASAEQDMDHRVGQILAAL